MKKICPKCKSFMKDGGTCKRCHYRDFASDYNVLIAESMLKKINGLVYTNNLYQFCVDAEQLKILKKSLENFINSYK